MQSDAKENSSFPEITTKQWEDVDGSETSAELRKGEIAHIGTYEAELFDTIHDNVIKQTYAVLIFEGKESIKRNTVFENGRYDLGDGYFIFIRAINNNPDVVRIEIKGKINNKSVYKK